MKALPVTLASPWTALDTTSSSTADDAWLAAFQAGDRRVLEQVHREHIALVDARVGRVLVMKRRVRAAMPPGWLPVSYRELRSRTLRKKLAEEELRWAIARTPRWWPGTSPAR